MLAIAAMEQLKEFFWHKKMQFLLFSEFNAKGHSIEDYQSF